MPVVWVPALLRPLTEGRDRVEAEGRTLAEIVDDLDRQFPGLKSRLCQDRRLRPGLAAVVDGAVARLGLDESIEPASEIHFVHSIGGG